MIAVRIAVKLRLVASPTASFYLPELAESGRQRKTLKTVLQASLERYNNLKTVWMSTGFTSYYRLNGRR